MGLIRAWAVRCITVSACFPVMLLSLGKFRPEFPLVSVCCALFSALCRFRGCFALGDVILVCLLSLCLVVYPVTALVAFL